MNICHISHHAEAAILIPHVLGYAPMNQVVAISLCHSRSVASCEEREGMSCEEHEGSRHVWSVMSFDTPFICKKEDACNGNSDDGENSESSDGGNEESGSACLVNADALTAQLTLFVANFEIQELALVWFCSDLAYGLNSSRQCDEMKKAVAAVRKQMPSCQNANDSSRSRLHSPLHVSFTVTDYHHYVTWGAGEEKTLDSSAGFSRYKKHGSYHDLATGDYAQSVNFTLPPAQISRKEWVERTITQASLHTDEAFKNGAQHAYMRAENSGRPPSVVLWNRHLLHMLTCVDDRYSSPCIGSCGECCKRCNDGCVGRLLAHLSWQRIRDRVVLFSVHPTITSISCLSQRDVTALMREAAHKPPDLQRAQRVIEFLYYLAGVLPSYSTHALACVSYIQWWTGQGAAALATTDIARDRGCTSSMLKLVRYALNVQLPPPWM